MRILMLFVLLGASLGMPSAQAQPSTAETASHPAVTPAQATSAPQLGVQTLPSALAFVPAGGRGHNDDVRFEVRGAHGTLFLTPRETVFALPTAFPPRQAASPADDHRPRQQAMGIVRQRFVGAAPHPKVSGLELQPGVVNEYLGERSEDWRTQLPSYGAVQYYAVYPGVNLRYDGTDGQLKRSFLLAPGADASAIQWQYQGVDGLQLTATGDLQLQITVRLSKAQQDALDTPTRTMPITMTERAPQAWQDTPQGRVAVPVQFVLANGHKAGFALGAYDHGLPLVIDPEISYWAGFDTSQSQGVQDMVLTQDAGASVLLFLGRTVSTAFGTLQGIAPQVGTESIYVSKRQVASGAVTWYTYFGGGTSSTINQGTAIAADAAGNALITGSTSAAVFPRVPTTGQACSTVENVFVSRLQASNGMLTASHCLGVPVSSTATNRGSGIGVDPHSGTVWVAGVSGGGDFLASGLIPLYLYGLDGPGQPVPNRPTQPHGFLAKLDTTMQAVLVRAYFGTFSGATVTDLAVDSQGRPIVVGRATATTSDPGISGVNRFPSTDTGYQTAYSYGGNFYDGYVFQLSADGNYKTYGSWLGDVSTYDDPWSVTVGRDANDAGDLYVAGSTMGSSQAGQRSFATPAAMDSIAWQTIRGTNQAGFVVRLNPTASGAASLRYGSLLRSTSTTQYVVDVRAVAARNGVAYLVGDTPQTDMLLNPVQAASGSTDAFLAALDTTKRDMPLSSYIGSTSIDQGHAVQVLSDGSVLVGGRLNTYTTSVQAYLARISPTISLSLSITDANGQPVQGLLNNADGWPVLNSSGSGVVANPLTITAVSTNTTTALQQPTVKLSIAAGASPTKRFYVYERPLGCISNSTGTSTSFTFFEDACILVNVAPGATRTHTWKLWVQPSLAGTLPFQVELWNEGQLVSQTAASIAVPQADIRPVVLLPAFFGSLWQTTMNAGIPTENMVLEPFLRTYDDLLQQWRVLGYEDNVTIAMMPYAWYYNTLSDLSAKLENHLTGWWQTHTRPSYVHPTEFDLIGHSTGGLLIRQYVANYGAAKVHNVSFVATPQQGSPMSFGVLEGLDPQNGQPGSSDWRGNTSDIVMLNVVRALAKKAGCMTIYDTDGTFTFSVSDSELYSYVQGQPCATRTIDSTRHIAISASYPQPGIPLLKQLLPSTTANAAHPYVQGKAGYSLPFTPPTSTALNTLNAPGVVNTFVQQVSADGGHIIEFFTDNLQTVTQYVVENDAVGAPTPLWRSGQAKPLGWNKDKPLDQRRTAAGYQLTGGDVVVPDWSASLSMLVTDSSLQSKIISRTYRSIYSNGLGPIHGRYFKDTTRSLKQVVGRLIIADPSLDWISTLPTVAATDINYIEVGKWLVLSNYCPVTMLLTDPQGRQIGTRPDGNVVNEIPYGFYTGHSGTPSPDLMLLPMHLSGTYTITITGREVGPFQVQGQLVDGQLNPRMGLWLGQLQPGQTVSYTFSVPEETHIRTLLVDDLAGSTVIASYTNALQQLNVPVDSWNVSQQGVPTMTTLAPYQRVIWVTGASIPPAINRLLLFGAYTRNGGGLLVTGQDIDHLVTGHTDVFQDILQTGVTTDTTNGRSLVGEDLFAGLTFLLNGADSANNQTSPGVLAPLVGSTSLAHYSDGGNAGSSAALRSTSGQGRLLYLGFGLEGVQTASMRQILLRRMLEWLSPTMNTTFPTMPILDTFNRADGPVGTNWLGGTQTYSIAGNALHNVGGDPQPLLWNASFGPSQEVFTTINSLDADASEVDLVLKAQDSTPCNLLEVWYQPAQSTAQVWTCHNWGSWTQHGADIPLTLAAGDHFGARAQADGTVTVYKNGTAVGSVTVDNSWPYTANGGRVGVWLIDAPGTVLDDVGGGTVP